jgi:hypothetical protein
MHFDEIKNLMFFNLIMQIANVLKFTLSLVRISDMYVDDPLKHSERIPVYLEMTLMKMDCKCEYILVI